MLPSPNETENKTLAVIPSTEISMLTSKDFYFIEDAEDLIKHSQNSCVIETMSSGFIQPDKGVNGVAAVVKDRRRELLINAQPSTHDPAALHPASTTFIVDYVSDLVGLRQSPDLPALTKSEQIKNLDNTAIGQYSQKSAFLFPLEVVMNSLLLLFSEGYIFPEGNHRENLVPLNTEEDLVESCTPILVRYGENKNFILLGNVTTVAKLLRGKGSNFVNHMGFSNPLLSVLFKAECKTAEIAKLLMQQVQWAESKIQDSLYGDELLKFDHGQPHLQMLANFIRTIFNGLNDAVIFEMSQQIKKNDADNAYKRLREIFYIHRLITEFFASLLLTQESNTKVLWTSEKLTQMQSVFKTTLAEFRNKLEMIKTTSFPKGEDRANILKSAASLIFGAIKSWHHIINDDTDAKTSTLSQMLIGNALQRFKKNFITNIQRLRLKNYSSTCQFIFDVFTNVLENLCETIALNTPTDISKADACQHWIDTLAHLRKFQKLSNKILQRIPELDEFFQTNNGELPQECINALDGILKMMLSLTELKQIPENYLNGVAPPLVYLITLLDINDGAACKNAWISAVAYGIKAEDKENSDGNKKGESAPFFTKAIMQLIAHLENAIVNNQSPIAINLTIALKNSYFVAGENNFKNVWDDNMKTALLKTLCQHLKDPENTAAFTVYELVITDSLFLNGKDGRIQRELKEAVEIRRQVSNAQKNDMTTNSQDSSSISSLLKSFTFKTSRQNDGGSKPSGQNRTPSSPGHR